MPKPFPYCFISYSRRDVATAKWLQRELESYRYPTSLVDPERRPVDSPYIRPVFRDKTDLPTSEGTFWEDIVRTLENSQYLIVLCSRHSASSEYVDKEIAAFIGRDEGRLDRIILAIVDPEIRLTTPAASHFPPEILRRWASLRSRNHPQLRSDEGESTSEARKRGLMQIASFMLGVDWPLLYNRFLIAQRRKARRLIVLGIMVSAVITGALSWALWKEYELTTFERRIFPRSLVFGYVGNFLSPLITSLEKQGEEQGIRPLVIIALPDAYGNLDHAARVGSYRDFAAANGFTAEATNVVTEKMPRGAVTAKISPVPEYYASRKIDVYIDFASTVTAFKDVILYKKGNKAYAQTTENGMLLEYADEFEKAVLEVLPVNQRDRVVFVRSPEAALRVLQRE